MLIENLYAVVARRTAENAANTGRLLCSTLLFVSVVDYRLLTMYQHPSSNQYWRRRVDPMLVSVKL